MCNTRVDVYQGATGDRYGDTIPNNTTPAATGIPVHLVENPPVVNQEGATTTPLSVTGGTLRFVPTPARVALFAEDARVLDSRTGAWWVIDHMHRPSHAAGLEVGRCDVTAVGA